MMVEGQGRTPRSTQVTQTGLLSRATIPAALATVALVVCMHRHTSEPSSLSASMDTHDLNGFDTLGLGLGLGVGMGLGERKDVAAALFGMARDGHQCHTIEPHKGVTV